MEKGPKKNPTLFLDASNLYESWVWGDPNVTEKQVKEVYVQAVKDSRNEESLLGKSLAEHSITQSRLRKLGIDPETLQPLDKDSMQS